MIHDIYTLNIQRNVTLTIYVQEVGGEFGETFQRRPAVVILPGGAYQALSDREAEPVAAAFLDAGFQAFILRYSIAEHNAWPNPLNDYEEAMKLLLEKAEDWHIDTDRICVAGFSAGGHLAACAATMSEHRPAAAILGYPAIVEEICDICQKGLPYPYQHVDEKTCPCFIFGTRTDNVVPMDNEIAMMEALNRNDISFESHIYSFGPHGFSTGRPYLTDDGITPRAADWVGDAIEWLGEVWGVMKKDGYTEPKFSRAVNGNHEPFLSLNCTVAYLTEQEKAKEILKDIFPVVDTVLGQFPEEAGLVLARYVRMIDLLTLAKIPESLYAGVEEALREVTV